MYSVGQKVQALDILGRWENGRVVQCNCEENTFIVHFCGWDDSFDTEVNDTEIRRPIALLQTISSDIPSKRSKRKVPCDSMPLRAHASQLQRDVEVDVEQDGHPMTVKVHTVDRFKGTTDVLLPSGRPETFSIKDVFIHKSEDEVKKFVAARKPVQKSPQVAQDPVVDRPSLHPDTAICTTSAISRKGIIIRCGSMYGLKKAEGNVVVLVKLITLKPSAIYVKGCLVIDSEKCDEMVLEAPISSLTETIGTTSRDVSKAAYIQMSQELATATSDQRFLLGKSQITMLLFQEIKMALKSKSTQRHCILGLLHAECDLEIFPVKLYPGQRTTYGYNYQKCVPLSLFDNLLPEQWDVLASVDNCNFTYVTKLVLSLSEDLLLKMSIATAICRQVLSSPSHYRPQIQRDIQNVIDPPFDDELQ